MKLRPQILASSLLFLAVSLGIWLNNAERDTPQAPSSGSSYVVPVPPPTVVSAPILTAQAEPETPPMQSFAKWVETYRLTTPTARPQLEAEGEKIAEARQAQVYNLIKENPKAALEAAVAESERRLLPERITRLLERPINARGELALVAATPIPGQAHLIKRPMFREARLGSETLDAYVYGERAKQDTKYDTSILGIAVKDRIAVLDAPSRIFARAELPAELKLEPGIAMAGDPVPTAVTPTVPVVQARGKSYPVCCAAHAAALASQIAYAESHPGTVVDALGGSESTTEAGPSSLAVTGAQSVLVILTKFSDFPNGPIDPATSTTVTATALTNRITNDVSDFLNQASYSKVSISSVSVTSVLSLPGNPSLASYASTNKSSELKSDALAAAKTAGFTTANYDHVVVMFPDTHGILNDNFTWSGLADVGGNFVWLNGDFSLRVVAHELNHNFGMRHANLWRIPVASIDPVDPAGHGEDYGDPFDIMGDGPSDAITQPDFPNPWALNRIHWLADSAVNTISTSGTYRVYRYDHKDAVQANTLALKLQRTANTDYWLGYRRKYVSHATHSDVSNGAYIFWGYHDNVASNLIDIDTPGSNDRDASLNVGSTFNDSAAGVSFQVTAAGGSGTAEYLEIAVSFQPRLVFASAAQSVDEQAGQISIVVQRQNNSTGAISAHYATANGTATAGSDYTSTSGDLNWADGDSSPKTITIPITSDAVTEGAQTFTVNLSALSGAVSPNGNTITVTIQEPGAEDLQFIASGSLNSAVRAIALRPDGKAIVGGFFNDGIALLNTNGSRDTTFDQGPGPDTSNPELVRDVFAVARQANGKILVGGKFTTIRNFAAKNLARLNEDGNYDTSFSVGVGPDDQINDIKVQPDGKILVAGNFTHWNGTDALHARAALVRLNEDGSLDTTLGDFNDVVDPPGGGNVIGNCIALQPIAAAPFYRILVGGHFSRPYSSGGFHSGIVALKAADGTRDTTFDAPIGASHIINSVFNLTRVSNIALQPDGKIVLGGQFIGFNGSTAGHIVRLTATGANDSTFAGGVSGNDVTGLIVQGDGKIVVCGDFSTASGANQKILARYTSAGALDTAFKPSIVTGSFPNDAALYHGWTPVMQSDGRILTGLNGAGSEYVLRRYFSSQAQTPSVIQFTSTSTSAAEGSSATLIVQRTGGTLGAVSVNYATIARSATAGSDYTSSSGTLTWAAADSAPKTISVPVLTDADTGESDEVFEVQLGAPVGGVLLGENQAATVNIIGVDPATVPHFQFASSGTMASEAAGSFDVTITASLPPVSPISVPFVASGSATSGTDYTVSPSPLAFGIGETSKTVTITLTQDSLLETNETITLTLGNPTGGTALLGTQTTFSATITDDEALPTIAPLGQPSSHIAELGKNTTFTVTASANPTPNSYQWRKVTSNIGTATASPSLTLSNLALTSAGSYNVIVKNTLGSKTSDNATLGVLDTGNKTINGVAGSNATLTAYCSTNITGFQWYKNGAIVTNVTGHITGATSKSLVITKLVNAAVGPPAVVSDAGAYTCVVTLAGATMPRSTGTYTLNVIDTKPDITDSLTLPDAVVGGYYEKQITFDTAQNKTPTSFSASPLPHGLSINTATGKISGTPRWCLPHRPAPV